MTENIRTVEALPVDGLGVTGAHSLPAVIPEDLLARAIDKGVDVATLERLLAMRSQLRAEAARDAYYSALAAFQRECPPVQKSKTVLDKYGKLRYRYAPLEEIVRQVGPLISAHGFSYTLDTEQTGPPNLQLTAICRTHHVGGHSEETRLQVPISGEYMSAQQLVGSARTYASRYAFCNAWGIMTADEDDDGNASTESSKEGLAGPSPKDQAPGASAPSHHSAGPVSSKERAATKPRGPSPDPKWAAGAGKQAPGDALQEALKAVVPGPPDEDFTLYQKHLHVIEAGGSAYAKMDAAAQRNAIFGKMLLDIAQMKDLQGRQIGLAKLWRNLEFYEKTHAQNGGNGMSQAMLEDMHAIKAFFDSRKEYQEAQKRFVEEAAK